MYNLLALLYKFSLFKKGNCLYPNVVGKRRKRNLNKQINLLKILVIEDKITHVVLGFCSCFVHFFLIGIHSMQGWTATTRHFHLLLGNVCGRSVNLNQVRIRMLVLSINVAVTLRGDFTFTFGNYCIEYKIQNYFLIHYAQTKIILCSFFKLRECEKNRKVIFISMYINMLTCMS